MNTDYKTRHPWFCKKILPLAVAGLIATPGFTFADQALDESNDQANDTFTAMDTDSDSQVVWHEIQVIMAPRILAANLDQERIFSRYDEDSDDALNQQEFEQFLSDLEEQEIASAEREVDAADNDYGDEVERNNENARVTENSQHGADQSVVRPESRYGDDSTLAPDPTDQETQANNGMQSDSELSTRAESQSETFDQNRDTSVAGDAPELGDNQYQAQDLRNAPIESLQNKTVRNSAGEEIGELKNVVVNPERGEIGFVITSGGVLGIGKKRMFAPVEELSLAEDDIIWQTDSNRKELKESAKYRADEYVEVSEQYKTIDQLRRAGLSAL